VRPDKVLNTISRQSCRSDTHVRYGFLSHQESFLQIFQLLDSDLLVQVKLIPMLLLEDLELLVKFFVPGVQDGSLEAQS